jgi:DNA polymerase eta
VIKRGQVSRYTILQVTTFKYVLDRQEYPSRQNLHIFHRTVRLCMASALSSALLWEGKGKAVEFSHEDFGPVVTYRHLHSHGLGVKDPLRVVALCDSDAFYAACEQVRLGIDPGKPLVVQQWQSLIAVNYPARKYGISRMDNVNDAKKRCPHLEVVHVATYKEGEAEPGYWQNPDTLTHKVGRARMES